VLYGFLHVANNVVDVPELLVEDVGALAVKAERKFVHSHRQLDVKELQKQGLQLMKGLLHVIPQALLEDSNDVAVTATAGGRVCGHRLFKKGAPMVRVARGRETSSLLLRGAIAGADALLSTDGWKYGALAPTEALPRGDPVCL
jgi:hypothetical protein